MLQREPPDAWIKQVRNSKFILLGIERARRKKIFRWVPEQTWQAKVASVGGGDHAVTAHPRNVLARSITTKRRVHVLMLHHA